MGTTTGSGSADKDGTNFKRLYIYGKIDSHERENMIKAIKYEIRNDWIQMKSRREWKIRACLANKLTTGDKRH